MAFENDIGPPPLTPEEILNETIKDSKPPGPPSDNTTIQVGPAETFSITQAAPYIAANDAILVYLATVAYKYTRPISINDLQYFKGISSARIAVYTTCSVAYVCVRGTSPGKIGGIKDILDDLVIAMTAGCELDIVIEGWYIMSQLRTLGYREFKVCGHSLGGRGALCLSRYEGVTQCVALNAGGGVTAPANVGVSPAICTHYHIVGDMISTHIMDNGCKNVRVVVGDALRRKNIIPMYFGYSANPLFTVYDVNFLSLDNHSASNFLSQQPYAVTTAQEEQNSLEYYWFQAAQVPINLLSTILGAVGGQFYQEVGTMICANPIPGAQQWIYCRYQNSGWKIYNDFMNEVLGGISGFLIGFVTLGPSGAIEGAQAGIDLAKGDINSILEKFIPNYNNYSYIGKYALGNIIPKLSDIWRGKTVWEVMKMAMNIYSVNNLGIQVQLDDDTRKLLEAVTLRGQIPQSSDLFDPEALHKFEDAVVRLTRRLPPLHSVEMELGKSPTGLMTEEEYQKQMQEWGLSL